MVALSCSVRSFLCTIFRKTPHRLNTQVNMADREQVGFFVGYVRFLPMFFFTLIGYDECPNIDFKNGFYCFLFDQISFSFYFLLFWQPCQKLRFLRA